MGRRSLVSLQSPHRQGCGTPREETRGDRSTLNLVTRGSWRNCINVMRTRRSQSSSDPVSSTPLSGEGHRSVLLHEAIESLTIAQNDIVVDATLGGGGHAKRIAGKLGKNGMLIGFDLDGEAVLRAREALQGVSPRVLLFQKNFRELRPALDEAGVPQITKALFDLGWSSYQLDSGRGFSFLKDEPLLMTYATDIKPGMLTAEKIVNTWEEGNIADVLWGWGEERYSRKIARAIVEARAQKPIKTSQELADIVSNATPYAYRRGRIHPATRTFQALRIAVNDELGALAEGLRSAWEALAPGGRIAVIAFHSIEDRIVKNMFAEWEKKGEGLRMTKKPMSPSSEEIRENPRARSAKLRVIEKN